MNIIKLIPALLFYCSISMGQRSSYTVSNAHAHNDYENAIPFYMAYDERFGSIEADIFLENGELIVAHDVKEILLRRTLEQYYLQPLIAATQRNRGFPYPDSTRQLQMLIDIKTDALQTIQLLIATLRKFPMLIDNPKLIWVITGNRPEKSQFISFPPFIFFDGELSKEYSKESLFKIALFSDNFKNYSRWNGQGNIPSKEEAILRTAINKAHQLFKPVRFWNAPDDPNAWKQFIRLKVDYINTDHITELSSFLRNQADRQP
jgi:alkaline phosphatase